MSEQNIAASKRLFDEAWNQGSLDVIDELCSADFVDHDPMGDRDIAGIKEAIQGYRGAFPDLTIEIDEIFAAGDKVVVRWTANGTFENGFMGQEPTGEKGQPIEGIGIDRFDADGKVAEAWGQWNLMTFMQNIGLAPVGAEAEAATA